MSYLAVGQSSNILEWRSNLKVLPLHLRGFTDPCGPLPRAGNAHRPDGRVQGRGRSAGAVLEAGLQDVALPALDRGLYRRRHTVIEPVDRAGVFVDGCQDALADGKHGVQGSGVLDPEPARPAAFAKQRF